MWLAGWAENGWVNSATVILVLVVVTALAFDFTNAHGPGLRSRGRKDDGSRWGFAWSRTPTGGHRDGTFGPAPMGPRGALLDESVRRSNGSEDANPVMDIYPGPAMPAIQPAQEE